MPWDWNLVGEIFLGMTAGIAVGGWIAAATWDGYVWRWLSHPTARKIASAADKVTGGEGGILGFLKELFR